MANYKDITNNNYNSNITTNASARQDFEMVKDMTNFIQKKQDQVTETQEETRRAYEEAAKARIDTYSSQKANEQNVLYERYMNEAIYRTFEKEQALNKKEIELERSFALHELGLMKKEKEVELKKAFVI